jgi:Zn-dependent peptidase ImmA (M78 family)/transcriptional regulator with XRE-family HTH domain
VPTREFQPARLRHARQLRGRKQAELAQKIGLTAAAVSQYESGALVPSDHTVEQIAVYLGCLPSYFERPIEWAGQSEPFFRRRRATPAGELHKASAYALSLSEIAERIERDIEIPPSALDRRLSADDTTPLAEVEGCAADVRADWNLGDSPVPNVLRLLEVRGAVVAAVGAFDQRLDAFSLRTTYRPIVVLCSDEGAAARRRFDAAHELAHLLLHERPLEANAVQENQAHRFAAALLMPADAIDPWLPRRSNQLALLEEGSRIWGVSMQALLYRARTIGTISEDGFRRVMRKMSAAGWRKREPVEIGPPETPQLLGQAIDALPAAGSSIERVAEDLGYPVRRLKRMLSVPEHRADPSSGELVRLPRRAAV